MNPLSFLSPYKLFIEIGLLIAVLLGAAVGVHKFLDYEQGIGYDRAVAEYTAKLVAAQEKAISDTAILNKQLEDANNAAQKREQVIQNSANAASVANGKLRDTLDHYRDSVSGATAASLGGAVTALAALLSECSTRYGSLAEKADRHSSDFQRCVEAWPKLK